MTRLGRAALLYATRLGLPVFPCRGKQPYTEHGFLDATTDTRKIERWWRRWPNANVGIACALSHALPLDIDPRHGGDDELAALEFENGKLPHTPMAITGSGGTHYLFKRPLGVSFHPKPIPGIDVPNYIIAAPSLHPETGRAYEWDSESHPLETELAEVPSWLLARILRIETPDSFGQTADDSAKSFLALAFEHAGWLGKRIDSSRINCRCPWEDQHTAKSGSGGTVRFAPKAGSGAGWFHCAHTSHGPKTLQDVLAALPHEAVLAASAEISRRAAEETAYEDDERLAIQEER